MIRLRRIDGAADAPLCAQIYSDAVRGVSGGPYSDNELAAWAPKVPSGREWSDRFRDSSGFLAYRGEKAVGFMLMTQDHHIDLAFVLPGERGQGTAAKLYDAILAETPSDAPFFTFASLFFRPFVERRGWRVTETQQVERNGETLTRFAMALDSARTPLT